MVHGGHVGRVEVQVVKARLVVRLVAGGAGGPQRGRLNLVTSRFLCGLGRLRLMVGACDPSAIVRYDFIVGSVINNGVLCELLALVDGSFGLKMGVVCITLLQ